MKKLIAGMLTAIMVISLSACGSKNTAATEAETNAADRKSVV